MVPHIACSELFARLGDEDILVLDCREPDDWARFALHVPGALHLTAEELAQVSTSLPDDELIVLCGADPAGRDERRAWQVLRQCGLGAVCLQGGLHEWITCGFPTERHAALQAHEEHAG